MGPAKEEITEVKETKKETKSVKIWTVDELPEAVKKQLEQLEKAGCAPKNPRPGAVQRDFILYALGTKSGIKNAKPGLVSKAINIIIEKEPGKNGNFAMLSLKQIQELNKTQKTAIKKNLEKQYEELKESSKRGGGKGRTPTLVDVEDLLENF